MRPVGTGRASNSSLSLARSGEECRIACSSAAVRVSSETRTGEDAVAGDDGAAGVQAFVPMLLRIAEK